MMRSQAWQFATALVCSMLISVGHGAGEPGAGRSGGVPALLLVRRHQRTGERALRRLPDLGLLSDRLQRILLRAGL